MYTNLYLVEELERQRRQQFLEAAVQNRLRAHPLAHHAAHLPGSHGQDETQHAMGHAAPVSGPPRQGDRVAGAASTPPASRSALLWAARALRQCRRGPPVIEACLTDSTSKTSRWSLVQKGVRRTWQWRLLATRTGPVPGTLRPRSSARPVHRSRSRSASTRAPAPRGHGHGADQNDDPGLHFDRKMGLL